MFKHTFYLDKKCDGVVHCIEGEDEADETCKDLDLFPEEATIECIENRLGYNITIKATPCDGIKECRDESDEQCEENYLVLVGVVAVFLILTNVIYHYLKWYHLGWKDQIIPEGTNKQIQDFSHMVGDDLAKLKV